MLFLYLLIASFLIELKPAGIFLFNELGNASSFSNLSNWLISSPPPYNSTFNGETILGGQNIFNTGTILTKTISSLPSHYKFELDFYVYALKHFVEMSFNIFFDGNLVANYYLPLDFQQNGYTFSYFSTNGTFSPGYFSFGAVSSFGYVEIYSCSEAIYLFKVVSEHNSSDITIQFSASGDQTDFSWGIRNLSYYIWSENFKSNCTENCLVCDIGMCSYCSSPFLMNQEDVCVESCSDGYLANFSTGICYSCHSSCKTCIGNNPGACTSCYRNYFLYGNYCISTCPDGTYADLISQECQKCDNSCKTCFGGTDQNCSSCPVDNYFLSQNQCQKCDRTCLTCNGSLANNCLSCSDVFLFLNTSCIALPCQQDEYWDNNYLQCLKCDASCLSCNGPNVNNCLKCQNDSILFLNKCLTPVNLYAKLIPINSPFTFMLSFSPNITSFEFFQKLATITQIKISNFRQNLFNFTLKQIPGSTNYTLNLTYNDFIMPNTSYLEISINNTLDPNIILLNNSLNKLLLPYTTCPDSIFYYIENGFCIEKLIFDYSWKYTNEYNKIELIFKQIDRTSYLLNSQRLLAELNPILQDGVHHGMFDLHAKLWSLNSIFNYSFVLENGTVAIIFNFTQFVYSGINLILKFNEENFREVNNSQKILLVKKQLDILIMDHSSVQMQSQIMETTKNISITGEVAVTGLIYISYLLNPKSSFAIKGLLLLNMFQVLKFLEINYPQNARIIFTNSVSHTFLKGDVHKISEVDELLYGFPQIFVFYHVSLLVVNNVTEDFILIFLFLGVCLVLLVLRHLLKCRFIRKGVIFFESIVVWNALTMISFSKYINCVFFSLVSLRFSWGYDKFNSYLTVVLILYVTWVPIHIYLIIKNLNKLEKQEHFSNSPKTSIFSENSPNSNSKSQKKKSKFFQNTDKPIEIKTNGKAVDWKSFSEYRTPKLRLEKSQMIDWKNFAEYQTPKLPLPRSQISQILPFETTNTNSPKDEILEQTHFDDLKLENSLQSSKKEFLENSIMKHDISLSSSHFSSKNIILGSNRKTLETSKKYSTNSDAIFTEEKKTIESKKKPKFSKLICLLLWPCKCFYQVKDPGLYLKKFSILKKDFRETMGLSRFYFVIDLARYFLIPAMIPCLYGFPLIQITIISFTNVVFFFFLISETPYKSKINSVFSFVNEICLILVYFAAFVISMFDVFEFRNVYTRIQFGWVIVFAYLVLLGSLIFGSVFRILRAFYLCSRKLFPKKNRQEK